MSADDDAKIETWGDVICAFVGVTIIVFGFACWFALALAVPVAAIVFVLWVGGCVG